MDVPMPHSRLDAIFAQVRPGHSLPREFYGDPELYRLDLETIFHRHWIFAGATCEIPSPGSYLTFEIADTSVLVVRDRDGVIRAFYNTCRHRGFRLCDAKRGQAATLLCPYHHWGYRLDGTLARAAAMGDDFDKSLNGLRPIHLRIVAGTMYVCLADDPPDFAPYAAALTAQLAPHGLERAKLAAETSIVVDGNWKLTMENSRECYHCAGQHKELTHSFLAIYDFENPDQLTDVQAYWQKWHDFGITEGTAEGPEYRASRLPLINGAVSITNDGELAVKRPLGEGPADAYGSLRWVHYPSTFNHAINDYAVLIRMLPLGPEQTVITTKWLVDRDAEEGRDYDLTRLMETWDITNEQDKRLIERNQAGVRSHGYVPGPYSPTLEAGVVKFVDWYLLQLVANGPDYVVPV